MKELISSDKQKIEAANSREKADSVPKKFCTATADNIRVSEKVDKKEAAPETARENTQEKTERASFREIDKRYVLGETAGTFRQIPFPVENRQERIVQRNDIAADIAQIGNLLIMGASMRGESHYAQRVPRQDNYLIQECIADHDHSYVIAAIADGLGNAELSDEFSDMLVNVLCYEISRHLKEEADLTLLDWETIADTVWKMSLQYCYRQSGSDVIEEYFEKWASTLECVVIESNPESSNRFAAVTIAGDGALYKLDAEGNWNTIKHGKAREGNTISNLVSCLPEQPRKIIVHDSHLSEGDSLFLVTDGLSDYLEEYQDVRMFFQDNLPQNANLPEFIRVLNVAVEQMDDDKTGIYIIQHGVKQRRFGEVKENSDV